MSAACIVRRGALLAITAVSLYLLAPAIAEVFGAWDRLDDVNPLWFVAMLLLQAGSYGLHVGGPAARAAHASAGVR